MARAEDDDETLVSVESDAAGILKKVEALEFQRMFSNPLDPNNCFLDIQAGSGGTEAQDWTAMLERMYLQATRTRRATRWKSWRSPKARWPASRARR